MRRTLQRAVSLLLGSSYWVALTGAGISTASGIPDFRSPRNGLWLHHDPMEVASLWGFRNCPDRFYEWARPLLRKTHAAAPNMAHRVLAEMERAGRLRAIVTQNIDSLHQMAESQHVLELHGHTRSASCLACRHQIPGEALVRRILAGGMPARCVRCGGLMKPDILLFGEPVCYEVISAAQQEALRCDLMLVVGTSLEVMPAGDLPLLARRRGARLILINLAPTTLDDQMDVVIRAQAAPALEELWHSLLQRM